MCVWNWIKKINKQIIIFIIKYTVCQLILKTDAHGDAITM